MISRFHRHRALKAKKAFTTRRVPVKDMRTILSGNIRPKAGDLVLARVQELGKHKRLELRNGRRARMLPGDEIIVAYGNRYASDQYEALVADDLSGCDLVAAGGIAAKEVCRHERVAPPTWIVPIGLLGDEIGRRLNLKNYAVKLSGAARPIKTVLVVGTGMNAGKTYSAASIIHGLKAKRTRVAGIKVTGTGAGGDLWHYRDLGADVVYDFTDAGFASTYKVEVEQLEELTSTLLGQASRSNCCHAVVEVADGLQQAETAGLLRSKKMRGLIDGVVFAAYDAMGAQRGVEILQKLGHKVLAVSGQLCRSPLAMREAAQTLDVPVYHPGELQQGVLFEGLSASQAASPAQHEDSVSPLTRIVSFGYKRNVDLNYDLNDPVRRLRFDHANMDGEDDGLAPGAQVFAYPHRGDEDTEIDEAEGA